MLKGTVKSQLFKGMHYETVVETRVGTSITVKMQVSQDRPVYNEEKGEKISANAFLLDVEDVEELDDAKVVALASAEAWDAETEEPISIKTVEAHRASIMDKTNSGTVADLMRVVMGTKLLH